MPDLHVLRHAKAEADARGGDRERALTDRGRATAAALAEHARRTSLRVDVVLCSPARRAKETMEPLLEALGHPDVRMDEDLYAGGVAEALELIRALPPAVTAALVVGHNPTLQDLVETVSADAGSVTESFPAGALASVRWDGPWSSLLSGSARLVNVYTGS